MAHRAARILVGAAVGACLLLAPSAGSASKLDARLRALRGTGGSGGFGVAGAGGGTDSGERFRFLLRVLPGTSPSALSAAYPGLRAGAAVGDVIPASADAATLDALAADSRVLSVEAATQRKPTLDVARSSRTVGGVFHGVLRNGLADLAGLDGTGVVVGIVDTGIDWQHRDFSNDGSPDTTRILAIWDQTISSHTGGAFPSGYNYGAEYTRASIDAKLAGGGNVINTVDSDGHGTHVASLAAGDGTATNGVIAAGTYRGIAPGADIVMVKTSFFDSDIVDGMAYIVAKAAAAGKRAVINLSLGGQSGPHDGTSSFETGVAAIAASTPVIVAIGNDHANSPHAKAVYTGLNTLSFAANVADGAPDSVDMEFWHPGGDAYTVTVTLFGQGGSAVAAAGATDSETIGGHTVEVYNATNSGHPLGHKQIYVRVTRSGGVTIDQFTAQLTRTTAGGTGRVDGFVDPSFSGTTWSTQVDNTTTMGVPATANNVITVGSYVSNTFWDAFDGLNYSFTVQNAQGTASHFSANGPTRDGRQAPELVAPGDVVGGAQSANATAYAAACDLDGIAPHNGCFILRDNRHRILRGTSMAAPIAAGAMALRLQAQPELTVAGLRTVMRALARTDTATGSVPNDAYGYGKLVASPQPVVPPASFGITTMGTSSITWTWGAVQAASHYRVYYATNTSSLIATLTSPTFVQTGLTANTTYGLFVRGMTGGVDGPGTSVSTATFAALAVPGTATGHVSSVTLTFTSCPAAPTSLSCSGYSLTASTDAAFNGVTVASVTSNRASTSLTVSGLSPLTTYYLRLATLNPFGGGIPVVAGSTHTASDVLAPISPSLTQVTSTSARFNWVVGGNPAGLTYVAQASSMTDFSGTVFTSTTLNIDALFSALSPNTSYYYRVQAVGGPFLVFGPAATDAVAATAPGAPFTAVSSNALTVSWGSGGNPAGTLYSAQLSPASDFSSGVLSSSTRNTSAGFSGLTPNTVYFARTSPLGHNGVSAGVTVLGSTATYAEPVVLSGTPFAGVSTGGFVFSFGAGANPPGTRFIVRVATEAAFSTVQASDTANASASFTGLLSNQQYWAQAAAVNLNGAVAPFSAAQTTVTFVKAVAAASPAVSTRSAASLTVAWSAAGFGAGTQYRLEVDDDPGFGSLAGTSVTLNAFATAAGLAPNTVYHGRVKALGQALPTPDGPYLLAAPSEATLANVPALPPVPITGTGGSSVTVAYLAPLTGTYAGFRVEASLSADFSAPVASVTAVGQFTATLNGLAFASTYYVRVAALNSAGLPSDYVSLGSTMTLRPVLSSGTAVGGGLVLSMPSAFAVLPGAVLSADAGTFPHNTVVTITAGSSQDVTAARGAVPMTALGAGIGFEISAAGQQPSKPVRLSLTYAPSQIPAGQDARRLRLARYDPASGLWQLVPSAVDAKQNLLTASLDHFSLFAPFFTTAGTSPDQVLIYPNPWEVNAGNEFSAQAMTFASLPSGANVQVLTMAGEPVWEAVAGPSGVLTWDGLNRFGHKAGSATYYVVIKSGGRAVTRRAVLIR